MTAPGYDDFVLNPSYPIRHVRVGSFTQETPGAPLLHVPDLSCGHEEETVVELEALKPLRIDVWHCTQCPKVPMGARWLDLMGVRR